ncbi:MAG TPA: DinB family protein [Terriglobales bacterium]|nr:DinB family protein [Terriglobales bacterium]
MSQGLTPEFVVTYRDMMVGGVKREAEITKKVILAVPDAKSDYRPDPNARTAKDLAWHIATSDVHFAESIANLKFDMSGESHEVPATIADIVAWYGQHLQDGLGRLEKMSGEQLLTPINFAGLFNFPAVLYLGFLNNHTIHHRGELATYLRPMGSKVPAIYGGSHDEPFKMPEPAETAA